WDDQGVLGWGEQGGNSRFYSKKKNGRSPLFPPPRPALRRPKPRHSSRSKRRPGRRDERSTGLDHRLTADQSRQLAQSASQSFAGKFAVRAWHLQDQLAALDLHRRPGKHTGLPSGEEIGDPHGGVKNARTIQHARCGKLAQPWRQLLFTQPGMAEIDRQREKRPSGVINCYERTVSDDVHRLLAPIVRMRAPTNVGQQAGGVAQATLV